MRNKLKQRRNKIRSHWTLTTWKLHPMTTETSNVRIAGSSHNRTTESLSLYVTPYGPWPSFLQKDDTIPPLLLSHCCSHLHYYWSLYGGDNPEKILSVFLTTSSDSACSNGSPGAEGRSVTIESQENLSVSVPPPSLLPLCTKDSLFPRLCKSVKVSSDAGLGEGLEGLGLPKFR